MDNAFRTLSEFAAALTVDSVPDRVFAAAEARVLDNVSVALAAANDPLIHRVVSAYCNISGEKNAASVWGNNRMAPVSTAAFLNAMMCHQLESDDVHSASKAHIGAVVIPAAWAMAQALNRSGKELLLAVITAYEVEARIAMAFGIKEHRARGWHVTATAGCFGAAAACGKLLRLDADTFLSCLGLAGAQSFGSWAFLGDSCNSKILNPARASAIGCDAAVLAAAGLQGPEHILTAQDGGLFRMMSANADPSLLSAGLGEVWEICNMDNKTYPCCRSTHCAIDGILSLASREKLTPDDVEKISIATYAIAKQQCAETPACLSPVTPTDAKFSTPYCVAAALVDGTVSMAEFAQEKIARPEIRALLPKIEVSEDPFFTDAYPRHWGCRVRVQRRDGSTCEAEIADASGSIYRPLSDAQALDKAVGMISLTNPAAAASIAELLLRIHSLEKLPIL